MENPITSLLTETMTYTLAEFHVHGLSVLAILGFKYCGHEFTEDHIALGVTILTGAIVGAYFARRRLKAKRALRLMQGPPVKWYHRNF